MQYEVEQKHSVLDVAALVAQITSRGAKLGSPVEQSDQYFAHPCRDFARTDEALRIRRTGTASFVTFKGPKLDTTAKTRRELELPLHPSDADGSKFDVLLQSLGFTHVAVVRKWRRAFHLVVEGNDVEGALDDVEDLGPFVELELQASESTRDEANRVIARLANELQLGPSERRSYLEMLLEKRS